MDALIFILTVGYALFTLSRKKDQRRREADKRYSSAHQRPARSLKTNAAGDTPAARREEQRVNSVGERDYAAREKQRTNAAGESRQTRQTPRQRQMVEEQRAKAAALRERQREARKRQTAEPMLEAAAGLVEPQSAPPTVPPPAAAATETPTAPAPRFTLPQLTPETAAQALVMAEILGPCRAKRRQNF